MPTSSATARAVASLSPVTIQTSSPSASSWPIASADSGLTRVRDHDAGRRGARRRRRTSGSRRGGPRPRPVGEGGGPDAVGVHQRLVAEQHAVQGCSTVPVVTVASMPWPGTASNPIGSGSPTCAVRAVLGRVTGDRGSHGVLAARLGGGDQGEQLVLVDRSTPGDDKVGEAGPTTGDGAGLVEHHGGDPAGGLERFAVADEDPELGGLPGADHDRGRGREPEGAGAGDDQDRDRRADREGHRAGPAARTEECPEGEVQDGHGEDRRDEPGGRGVGEPLHRHLRALRLLDEPDDLGEGRVVADRGDLHEQGAGPVEGGADDRVAGRLRDRDGLTGQHRLVDGRAALEDDAVDGDLLAGAHPDAGRRQ